MMFRLAFIATLVLIILKAVAVITWPWTWTFIPMLVWGVYCLILVLLIPLAVGLFGLFCVALGFIADKLDL
jgi:hypothetical protein